MTAVAVHVDAPKTNFGKAIVDIVDGFKRYELWSSLAWQDIRRRYRRSTLGPLWLTISTGAFIFGLGPLYGQILNQDTSVYLPYIAVSFVVWSMIAGMLTEACQVFIAAEGVIKQIRLPLSIYCYALVARHLIVFAHNVIILLIVFLFFPPTLSATLLLVPVGLLVIALNGVWVALLLGILCARFRDVPQMINSIVTLGMFVTPVMWQPEMARQHQWVVDWNPINHLIELVRAPIFGHLPSAATCSAVALVSGGGWLLAMAFFSRYRARIAYWV